MSDELRVIRIVDTAATRFFTLSDGSNVRRNNATGKYACLNGGCVKRRETVDCDHVEEAAVHDFTNCSCPPVEKC